MTIQAYSGFESGGMLGLGTGDNGEWFHTSSSSGGVIEFSTAVRRSGYFSLKCQATSSTNAGIYAIGLSGMDTDAYATFWLYIAERPTTRNIIVFTFQANGANNLVIRLTPAGELILGRGNNPITDLGSASSVLALDTWHRVDVRATGYDTGSLTVELKVNGTSIHSGSDSVISTTDLGVRIGPGPIETHDDTWEFYVDDIIVRNEGYETSDGGAVHLRPRAAGTDTAWTTGSFASVNELAADADATVTSSSSTTNAETYLVDDPADAGITGDIVAVFPVVIAKRATGSGSNISTRLRSGATVDDDAQTLSTSYAWKIGTIHEVDPDTGVAWTTEGLAAAEVGMVGSGAGTALRTVTIAALSVWATSVEALVVKPIITSVSPTSGPKAGGTAVTITGSGFTGATSATIGGVALTSFTVVSDTSITGTTGAISKASTYNVEVVHANGVGVLTNAYTYLPGNSTGTGGNNAGGAATVVVDVPTNSAGDMMHAFVTVRGTTNTVTQASWGAAIDIRSDGSTSSTHTFRKISNGSEPATYTFTLGTSAKGSGVIVATPDVDTGSGGYQVASQANASSANIVSPTLTPRRLGSVSVVGSGISRGVTITPPANYTEPAGAESASTGGGATSRTTTEGAFRTLATLTATGSITATADNSAVNTGTHLMLDPPGVIELPLIDNAGQVFSFELEGTEASSILPGLINQSAILFSPSIMSMQDVTPALIDQSSILFSPKVNQSLQLGLISQLAALLDPQINQSVSPDLIDRSAILFNPQLNQQVQTALISQLAAVADPQINPVVSPGLLSQLASLFDPTFVQDQFVTPDLIDQSPVLFNFQINQTTSIDLISQLGILFDPQINQTIDLDLIDRSAVLFIPQVNQSVVMGLITNLGQVYEWAIGVPGETTISPGLIDQSATIFAPQLNQQIRAELVSQLGQLFDPQVNQQVQLGVISQLNQIFNPQLNQQVQLELVSQLGGVFDPTLVTSGSISVDLIAQLAQVFDPTILLSGFVAPQLIDQSAIVFDPTFNVQQFLTPGLITSTQQLFSPAIQQLVQLGLIPSGITLFAPTVNMSVDIPLISQTPTIFSPTIVYAGQAVAPDLIAQLGQLFDPQINQAVHVPLIDHSGQVFAFAIVFTGSMNWHTQRGMADTKKGGWPGMQNAMNNAKRGR